jgi:hypothetical protein
MVTIRNFITDRPTEIAREIADLERELKELDRAERALGGGSKAAATPESADRQQPRARMTLAEMVLDVLRDHPHGADKRAIQDLIHQKHGARPATNSLTTQLSRLKSQHVLSLDGRVWQMHGRGHVE